MSSSSLCCIGQIITIKYYYIFLLQFRDDWNEVYWGYVIPARNLFMCQVEKAGSTTWKYFFWDARKLTEGINEPLIIENRRKWQKEVHKYFDNNKSNFFFNSSGIDDDISMHLTTRPYFRAIMVR